MGWRTDLSLRDDIRVATIPWDYLAREVRDRGAYLLILRLRNDLTLPVGSLGPLRLCPGYYVYVDSAMKNLTARVERHRRLRKRFHWHIDHLRQECEFVAAAPVRSSRREECTLAGACVRVLTPGPAGFGSSDCGCPTHLFYSAENPLSLPAFVNMLLRFRMRPPDGAGHPIP
jgi:sugar fermentation stimulation protein A